MATFSDETGLWVIFDTCTKIHYYSDLHNLLAMPLGYVMRYEYRRQWLTDEVADRIDKGTELPQKVVVAYAQATSYVRGADAPNAEQDLAFQDYLWVPTRLAEMINVVRANDRYYFDFAVGTYPSLAAANLFHELYDRHEVPYRKWVGLSLQRPLYEALQGGTEEERWTGIVRTLDVAPSQFAGDVFWRVNQVKRSGEPLALWPRRREQRSADGTRQVSTYYDLKEDSVYALELTTLRSPAPRAGRPLAALSVAVSSTAVGAVEVVGSGRHDVRQYTGLHVELATPHRDGFTGKRADIAVATDPRDGDWPQGPEIRLSCTVGKRWVLFSLGIAAGIVGLALGTSGVQEMWKGLGSTSTVLTVVGSVLLVGVGLSLLSGKPQLK